MPPAFRNTAGGSDKDGNGREGYGHARSLSEVAATDGPGGTRRFLDAAIFLLTVKTSAPPATAQIENEGGKGEGSGSGGGSRAGGMALRLPLRSAARAAKETLGCNGCRTLSPEPRPATAVHVTAAAALADIATGPEQPESSDDDQERGERDTTSSSDDWWARLRQVEQGWISSEADFHDGSRRDEESWIGLHLKLRPSDVHCVEGRIAIVDFLKGRLGKQVVGRDDDDDDDEEKEEEGHAEGGENDNTSLLKETHPQDVTKPADPTPSPAVTNIPTAVGGEEESGERTGGLPSSSKRSGSNSSNEQRSPRVIGTIVDAVEGQESGPQAAEGGVTVVVGVLVLGSELSKRDRAELHGQAEKAGGVASSSHGVGGGRFLSLTCSLANRTGAVELELSAEQVRADRVVHVGSALVHRAQGTTGPVRWVFPSRSSQMLLVSKSIYDFETRCCCTSFIWLLTTVFGVLVTSPQAELARRLFRLAQQEYHSRYECLSHREIRYKMARCSSYTLCLCAFLSRWMDRRPIMQSSCCLRAYRSSTNGFIAMTTPGLSVT